MEVIPPKALGVVHGDAAQNLVAEGWPQPPVINVANTSGKSNAGDKPPCFMTAAEFRQKLDAGVSEADMRSALVELMKKSFSSNDSSFDSLTSTLALHAVKESLVQYFSTGSSIPIPGLDNCKLKR